MAVRAERVEVAHVPAMPVEARVVARTLARGGEGGGRVADEAKGEVGRGVGRAGGHREAEIKRLSDQYRWGPVTYLVALVTGLLWPWAGIALCVALAVFFSFTGFSGRG